MKGLHGAILAGCIALAIAGCETTDSMVGGDEVVAPDTLVIPAGPFVQGSSAEQRDYAYRLDEIAQGNDRQRVQQAFDNELDPVWVQLPVYEITVAPITNAQYAEFVEATGHPAPDVDQDAWLSYRLRVPFSVTRRFAWVDGEPPEGREEHPVVLVDYADVQAYAAWLSEETGRTWRLPTEAEWEKAARGAEGLAYPWGNAWDPELANTADEGPEDTLPVGGFPGGASPFGLLDAAGHVNEWTSTEQSPGRHFVKGGAWDDLGCGACRPSSREGRPDRQRNVDLGFRLVAE